MKKLFYTLLLLLLPVVFEQAQVEVATEQNSFGAGPKFYEDILDFSSGNGKLTRIDVFIQVPYTTVHFVKSDSGFTGSYEVTVSIFDKDKEKLIVEKSWAEKLATKNFGETNSKDNFSINLKSFYLPPGKYFIRTAVDDKESNTEYTREATPVVRDLSSDIAISDIMLLTKRTEELGKNKIVPNVSGNVATQKDGLPIFYEIYSKAPAKVNIEYTVSDKKNNTIYKDSQMKNLDSGRVQIFNTIKDSSFSLGIYTLEVALKDSLNKTIASVKRAFISRWIGIPSSITDLDKAINQMIYIASTSEIDHIKDAKTMDEKLKRYLAFWKSQDPTPSTQDNEVFDEYYRRVTYANAHFSHYIEGWKTDRGMVFILLGPPDNVDRHPFDIDSKPYEVWEYYNLNRSFIFLDETGFGDYRLITPLTGDLYRFRR